MKLSSLQACLSDELETAFITLPGDTVLRRAGEIVLVIARAYVLDGAQSLEKGDAIDGGASLAYAGGWLDAGSYLGLLRTRKERGSIPVIGEIIDREEWTRLIGKATRYRRLLSEGLDAVEVAADRESEIFRGLEGLIEMARNARNEGDALLDGSDHLNALLHYSYGHAWLDTGIRTGFLRVLGRRELFTI